MPKVFVNTPTKFSRKGMTFTKSSLSEKAAVEFAEKNNLKYRRVLIVGKKRFLIYIQYNFSKK
jgi:hypothetical protein